MSQETLAFRSNLDRTYISMLDVVFISQL
ncbi:hypothetical protein [Paenibacillus tengchongensis]